MADSHTPPAKQSPSVSQEDNMAIIPGVTCQRSMEGNIRDDFTTKDEEDDLEKDDLEEEDSLSRHEAELDQAIYETAEDEREPQKSRSQRVVLSA